MSSVRGVVVLADQCYKTPLIQAIQARSGVLAIVRRCADLAEIVAAAYVDLADLAVIDGSSPDLTIETVESLRTCDMAVVALAPHHKRPRLIALEVASVTASGSPDQAVSSLIAATHTRRSTPATASSAPPPPPSPSAPGSVLAVWGTSGTPRRTTLAVGIATALSAHGPTFLVDTDTANPTIAYLLGLPVHVSGLSTLARTAPRGPITPADTLGAAAMRSENLHAITGLVAPHCWREVSKPGIESIVGALRLSARYSVADIASTSLEKASRGASRDDAVLGVLGHADRLVIVARGDIISINRLLFLTRWWEAQERAIPVEVIVSRVSIADIGPHPVSSLQTAIGTFMPDCIFHVVPEDEGVGRASLRGKTLGENGARCDASDALRATVEQWVPTL